MRSVRTLRGVILEGNAIKKVMDNDLRGLGYVITDFVVWPWNMDTNGYVSGKLWMGNDTDADTTNSQAQDNRAIAWSATSGATAEAVQYRIIDPEHIITNQLHVVNHAAIAMSYMITMRKVELSDNEEVMALIKERSQDDL